MIEDPRLLIINMKYSKIKHIVPVMSPKGGVGKTLIATLLSLYLSLKGYRVGLLDLDITNPNAHLVLGTELSKVKPTEDRGVVPPHIFGIKFMTIAFYSMDKPLPLRGSDIDSAVKELLAIINWGPLDLLFIDTPPGLSDVFMDVVTYIPKVKVLIVTTPSKLALKAIENLVKILNEVQVPIVGLIGNMSIDEEIRKFCKNFKINYLGSIPFDPNIDRCLGNRELLLHSRVGRAIATISNNLLGVLTFG